MRILHGAGFLGHVWPATQAWPSLGSSRPHSIRNVVVLPAPSGPTSPKISPAGNLQIQMIHGCQRVEAPGQTLGANDPFHQFPCEDFGIRGHVGFQLMRGLSISILTR